MTYEEEIALVASMAGHTITSATWEDENPGESWTGHEALTLTLDDGRTFYIAGWGHDAWGCTVMMIPPTDEPCRSGHDSTLGLALSTQTWYKQC